MGARNSKSKSSYYAKSSACYFYAKAKMSIDFQICISVSLSLDSTKACQYTDIPTKIIKNNADIFSDVILLLFNNLITTAIFPSNLKQAIVTPVFKKGDKNSKENYATVSTLAYLSDSSLNKFLTSWNLSPQNNDVVFVNATARSIAFYRCLKNGNQQSIKENIFVHF